MDLDRRFHHEQQGRQNACRPPVPSVGRYVSLALMAVVLIALVACGSNEEAATEVAGIPAVSPAAINELPQGIEGATIEITDGAFDVGDVFAQQDEPTTLSIVNNDDTAYRFRVSGGLVAVTDIPVNQTTEISFTSPKREELTGDLLAVGDDTVVDSVRITIQGPGGIGR